MLAIYISSYSSIPLCCCNRSSLLGLVCGWQSEILVSTATHFAHIFGSTAPYGKPLCSMSSAKVRITLVSYRIWLASSSQKMLTESGPLVTPQPLQSVIGFGSRLLDRRCSLSLALWLLPNLYMYMLCAGTAQALYKHCAGSVQVPYRHCRGTGREKSSMCNSKGLHRICEDLCRTCDRTCDRTCEGEA